MNRRAFLRNSLSAGLGVSALAGCGSNGALTADVVVYGATPAGLAAAVALREAGLSTLVIEPSSQIGGMVAGGIAVTDTGTPHLIGGISRRFFEEVAEEYGGGDGWARDPVIHFRSEALPWRKPRRWDLEPKVASRVFERWVKKHELSLLTSRRLANVHAEQRRIRELQLVSCLR